MKNKALWQSRCGGGLLLILIILGFALFQNFPFSQKWLAANVLDVSSNNPAVSAVFPANLSKIPRSHKVFGIKFAVPVDATTLNSSTMFLKDKNNTIVPGMITYDVNTRTAYFKANNNLTVNTSPSNNPFIFTLSSGVKDTKGRAIGTFSASYIVNNVLDTSPLRSNLNWTNPTPIIGAIGVDPLTGTIDIAFKNPLDPTTVSDSSWSYTAIPASTFTSKTVYNPLTQAISIRTTSPLALNTNYTINLNDTIKDASGNNLQSGLTLVFRTGDTLNASAPHVKWTQFNTNSIDVNFDFIVPLLEATAINSANYVLTCGGSSIDLSNAWFFYDSEQRRVNIGDIAIPEKSNCTLTLSSAITGLNGVGLDSASQTQTTAAGGIQKSLKGDAYLGDFAKSSEWFKQEACKDCKGLWDNPGIKFFNRIQAVASSNVAGEITAYTFTFPITVPLASDDELQIVFPTGFDISESNITSHLNIYNDLAKIVKITSLTRDLATGTITMPLQIGGDGKINGGLLTFTIKDIVNPQQAGNEYGISYQTAFAGDGIKEGPNKFNPITIKAAGNGEVVVTLLDLNTIEPLADVTVFFKSRDFGVREVSTNADGEAVLSNIAVNPASGTDIQASLDTTQLPNGYLTTSQTLNFHLTAADSTQSDLLFLTPAVLQIKGTITHKGIGLDGETKVNVIARGSAGIITKTFTLNKTESTDYAIDLTDEGDYIVFVDKFKDLKNGLIQALFIPSAPQVVKVTAAKSPITINITISATTQKITGTVFAPDNKPITNASVVAVLEYAKQGSSFSSVGKTNTSGSYSITVKPGNYRVEAHVPGYTGKIEKTVEIKNSDAAVNFILKKPNNAVSGRVSDMDDNPIKNAVIQCFNANSDNVNVTSDANGDYVMYVNDGIWSCEASATNLGNIPAASGVAVKNITINSAIADLNFALDVRDVVTIKGILKGASGGAVPGNWVGVEKFDKTTKRFIASVNSTKTDQNGNFSLIVNKTVPSEFYRFKTLTGQNARFVIADNIVATADINLGNILYPSEKTLTINITGAPADLNEVVVNIQNLTTQNFNTASIYLTAGNGSTKIDLPDANYTARLILPGFDEKSTNFTIAGANNSISFDYGNLVLTTLNVQVNNSAGAGLQGVYVEAFDQTTKRYASATSDSSGSAKLNVLPANYTIKASKQNSITVSTVTTSGITNYTLVLVDATANITLNLKDSNNNAAAYAWVDAVATDSSKQWIGSKANGDGTLTLNVPPGSIWNITARLANGAYGSKSAVTAGSTGVDIVLNQIKSDFIPAKPLALSVNPTSDNVITSNIADLTIEAGTLGNNSNNANLNIKKISDVPTTATSSALGGIGVEVSGTDNAGNSIDNLNSNAVVEVKYDKSQILALLNTGALKIEQFNTPLSSYDPVKGTWAVLGGANIYVTVQQKAGDNYITTTINEFVDNFDVNKAHPLDASKAYRNYNDFIIHYSATTNHFSVFAPVIFAPIDGALRNKSESLFLPTYGGPETTILRSELEPCVPLKRNPYNAILQKFIRFFTLQRL